MSWHLLSADGAISQFLDEPFISQLNTKISNLHFLSFIFLVKKGDFFRRKKRRKNVKKASSISLIVGHKNVKLCRQKNWEMTHSDKTF